MSTGKKILLSVLGVIVVLLVAVGGYLGKVYFDVKKLPMVSMKSLLVLSHSCVKNLSQ